MKLTFYKPVYKVGNPDGSGASLGTTTYTDAQELFAFEPEAVDYMEVTGEWPKIETIDYYISELEKLNTKMLLADKHQEENALIRPFLEVALGMRKYAVTMPIAMLEALDKYDETLAVQEKLSLKEKAPEPCMKTPDCGCRQCFKDSYNDKERRGEG